MKIVYAYLFAKSVNAIAVSRCPNVACSDTNYATDEDDWCLRVNFDKALPSQTVVTIRECKGFTKRFCNYA